MKARPSHAAQRAIQQLTIGVAKSTQARADRNAQLGLTETFQQYQIAVSGSAGTLPAFSTVIVGFIYPFHYAPGQRDSDLERPHMNFGAEADADVMIGATVTGWSTDEGTGAYTAAFVAVSAIAGADGTAFTGSVHLTFQGFSAPDDTGDLAIEG